MQLLGVKANRAEILVMLEKVGADENAELTPAQFNRVMTEVLTKKDASANSHVRKLLQSDTFSPLCDKRMQPLSKAVASLRDITGILQHNARTIQGKAL